MSLRLRLFIEHYLAGSTAVESARKAGYAHPSANAQRLLKRPEVEKAVGERVTKHALSADQVVAMLGRIAMSDIGDMLDLDDHGEVTFNFAKAKENDMLGVI